MKSFKFILSSSLVITASLTLSACDSSSVSAPTVSTPSVSGLREGGISGGGGGVVPADLVTIDEIRRVAGSARLELMTLVNLMAPDRAGPLKTEFGFTQKAVQNMLISDSDRLREIILRTEIHLEEDQPCLDRDGLEVDGSVASPTGTVCISAFRLQKKLTFENIRVQFLGLLAHEYLHLIGADEAEATSFQNDVTRLAARSATDAIRSDHAEIRKGFARIARMESALNQTEVLSSTATACTLANGFVDETNQILDSMGGSALRYEILSPNQRERYWSLRLKLQFVREGICTLPGSGWIAPDLTIRRQKYEAAFSGLSEPTLASYMPGPTSSPYWDKTPYEKTWRIRPIHAVRDALVDATELALESRQLEQELDAVEALDIN